MKGVKAWEIGKGKRLTATVLKAFARGKYVIGQGTQVKQGTPIPSESVQNRGKKNQLF